MNAPLLRGGQGRSDRDVREAAEWLAWFLCTLLVAVLAATLLPD